MSEGTHTEEDPDLYGSPHDLPRFQFIAVSGPPSGTDAATKKAIRKHVMGEIGRARRLPNRKRRKPLTIPLVVPSNEEWSRLQSPADGVELDQTSSIIDQDLENRRHNSRTIYYLPRIVGRAEGIHRPSRTKTENNILDSWIPTEALIGTFCWLGAGSVDPFAKYPFEMRRSDHALVAHSKYCN
jgi:hypothetical protein